MNNLSTVFFSVREFVFDLYCESLRPWPLNNGAYCLEIDIPMTDEEVIEYGLETLPYHCIYHI